MTIQTLIKVTTTAQVETFVQPMRYAIVSINNKSMSDYVFAMFHSFTDAEFYLKSFEKNYTSPISNFYEIRTLSEGSFRGE